MLRKIAADDKDYFAEARADGVVNRVVEHGLAAWPHSVELLEPAVAAAHPCGEYQKSRLHARIVYWNRGVAQDFPLSRVSLALVS